MYGSSMLLAAALAVQVNADTVPRPSAAAWTIDREQTLVAVVTHRAGFAARLAHNHLVVARDYSARVEFDPERIERALFDLEALVTDLDVDLPELKEAWEPRLAELDIVPELGAPSPDDRAEIRKTMLSDKQLDAEQFPRISVRVFGVRERPAMRGAIEFPFAADIEMMVHGETVTREAAARYTLEGDVLEIEAVADFTFEEFGIEPYSAFLGSVKNENGFQVFLALRATR